MNVKRLLDACTNRNRQILQRRSGGWRKNDRKRHSGQILARFVSRPIVSFTGSDGLTLQMSRAPSLFSGAPAPFAG
jgi:hypothetical protein